ncbi:MAG TPA: SRPBCC family protein [Blastocatellia bacterium]|nr:SRPBCC family protein [Blastocatellia bacterium]
MPFKIEEEFEVQAPVQQVWEYLIDPARVVVCIPGAELLETQDERTFTGAVKVKVGPVTMSYKGQVKFTEVDEQGRQVRMVGEGREAGGAGSAKVTMLSKVTPLDGRGALVVVSADVDLVGKVVQFGRGMIEEVSRQLFRQFSACVKKQLEAKVADEPQPSGSAPAESPSGENPPAAKTEALSAAPLVLHALWNVVARFFQRLLGRRPV